MYAGCQYHIAHIHRIYTNKDIGPIDIYVITNVGECIWKKWQTCSHHYHNVLYVPRSRTNAHCIQPAYPTTQISTPSVPSLLTEVAVDKQAYQCKVGTLRRLAMQWSCFILSKLMQHLPSSMQQTVNTTGLWPRQCMQMPRTYDVVRPSKDGRKMFWTYVSQSITVIIEAKNVNV